MASSVWNGLPRLPWNRHPDVVEGLVLSGGGSRASFQIGALRYLYDVVGIKPQVVVGTSAGSILGAMIAQHADPDDQAQAVRTIERLWYGMDQQSDMFTERPWFTRLRRRGTDWMALLQREAARPAPSWSLPRLNVPFLSRDEDADPAEHPDSSVVGEQTADPEELTGQAETLRLAMDDTVPTGLGWTPSMAMGLMSMLPRLRGASGDLSLILRGADATRSMYHPGPILAALLDPEVFAADAVSRSGITARFAIVGLHSGALHFMREDGRIVDRDDRLLSDDVHDVSRGVLASCSIPAVFRPVEIGGEWYIDGGTREYLPAEMAIGHLGASRCYVVSSGATGLQPATGFDTKSMLTVMMRATEILSDEGSRDEVAYARNAGAMVIEPEFNVHDPLTVDPGLIRIARDYGWLRAAEAHLELSRAERSIHREIIELRCHAHTLEAARLAARKSLDEPDTLDELAEVKTRIRHLLTRVRPEVLPEDAEQWWQSAEAHPRAASEHVAQLGD
ncbi:patatin-like phospholipase family protein [Aestuariimicrobium ganziense]|uniref:patatin-like phospholipase family protein n=1 Tax=Aestuariimicrobium ganziense TaxID=2773677 RepID=UPI001943BC16|nr:patatin-like phospholipase family protein [Aestuariimicrobium ganziense]